MERGTYILVALLVLLTSCQDGKVKDEWYVVTKHRIIDDSNRPVDSTAIVPNLDNGWTETVYFHEGQKVRTIVDTAGTGGIGVEYLFGSNEKFEIIREIWPNGQFSFECIVYDGHPYGLSTWWHSNGQKRSQGIRFKGVRIGVWNEWDKDGTLKEMKDHKKEELIDSLTMIRY